MSVDVLGMDAAFAAIDQQMSALEAAADAACADAGEACKAEAKARARVSTKVAKEGEEEHVHMRDRINHEHKHLESDVTSEADYSAYNEFGTSKMSAQPFMMPGFEKGRIALMDALKRL